MLVGDAAGYVTKCSGEGIYFAAKSGRMPWPQSYSDRLISCIAWRLARLRLSLETLGRCAETIAKNSHNGVRMIDEAYICIFFGKIGCSGGRRFLYFPNSFS